MRYWVFVLLLGCAFAFQHRERIEHWIDPPAPIAVPAGFKAVLYATEWCGYCARTRRLFEARGIPYREFDIEKSQEGNAQYLALGGNGVPVIVIGKQVIHGYDERAILDALAGL